MPELSRPYLNGAKTLDMSTPTNEAMPCTEQSTFVTTEDLMNHDVARAFVGFVCRIETMHRLLCYKSKFPNHFAFTLERYLFLLCLVHFI